MSVFQRLVLAVALIEIPVQLDIYLDYHRAEAYGAIGGWNISITTFCLAILYAAWLPSLAIRHVDPSRATLRAVLPALAYLLALVLSALVADQMRLAAFEVFAVLQAFLLFLYVASWVRGERDVWFVVTLLLIGLALESALMLTLRGVGHSLTFFHVTARIDPNMRVGGTIGSPNGAGSYLTMMLPLALGVLLCRLRLGPRALALCGFGLGAAALVVTFSRGSWVSAAFAIALVCFFAWRRGRLSPMVPAAIAASALIVCVVYSDAIAARLFGHDKGSAYARIPLMQIAASVIAESPILGSGTNNMAVSMQRYAMSADYRGGFVYVVHNRYLQVAAETGVVGLAAFLFFWFATLRRGWRFWKLDHRLSPLALGLAAGLAGMMLRLMVDVFNGRALIQTVWLFAGLIVALSLMNLRENRPPC